MEIVKIIEASTNKRATIKYEPFHKADVEKTWAKIKKAQCMLGWKPEQNISAGLKDSINWAVKNSVLTKQINL